MNTSLQNTKSRSLRYRILLTVSLLTIVRITYAMPPYPYIATDYATQLSLFTHHVWIGGFCIVGGAAHGAIFTNV
ncbi:hypothetical protein JKP88DRAFT_168009 [Tribonema minus]|uniref:Uncharacterized protein n=1 Tax=Tribonema minus TaxID=303371 RepID=A0A835YSG3_9STRA|nr:hypothetical protein JKP88DRAFT_168009 [Tribonema minus]